MSLMYAKDELILPAAAVLTLYCFLVNSSLKFEMPLSPGLRFLACGSVVGSMEEDDKG